MRWHREALNARTRKAKARARKKARKRMKRAGACLAMVAELTVRSSPPRPTPAPFIEGHRRSLVRW